jgi:cytosine/adenosine deaminase-related metal-dependent hydrolase
VLLNNVMTVTGDQPVHITVRGEKIIGVTPDKPMEDAGRPEIQFTDALAFPGLINSHDHLDFNCFSILGQEKYNNYTNWGTRIHENFKEEIEAIVKIPENLRAMWGMYKNLLAGVTTVVNHGPFLKIPDPLINIYQEPQNLHSVGFEKKWKWKLNNPLFKNRDCVIHTGEGSDELSHSEIDELIKYNFLKRKLIGVHGVAMDATQAEHFKGLVWCPESNRVLLNEHAHVDQLKSNTRLVFGTDSTLTGSWNIWRHLRLARSLQLVSDQVLFSMVTDAAANLWKMNNGELSVGRDADIVVARIQHSPSIWNDFYRINPSDILMIIHKGRIRMFDRIMLPQLNGLRIDLSRYNRISMHDAVKFIEGDLPALITSIRQYNRDVVFPVDQYEPA